MYKYSEIKQGEFIKQVPIVLEVEFEPSGNAPKEKRMPEKRSDEVPSEGPEAAAVHPEESQLSGTGDGKHEIYHDALDYWDK